MCAVSPLILKRASASRSSGEWSDDDYDVLTDGVVVGRIMKAAAKPADASWLWTATRLPVRRQWRRSLRVGGEKEASVVPCSTVFGSSISARKNIYKMFAKM